VVHLMSGCVLCNMDDNHAVATPNRLVPTQQHDAGGGCKRLKPEGLPPTCLVAFFFHCSLGLMSVFRTSGFSIISKIASVEASVIHFDFVFGRF